MDLHHSEHSEVAVGSASGDITLYNKDLKVTYIPPPSPPQKYTFYFLCSLQLLTKVKGAHSVFVTSLCFLKLPSPADHDKEIVLSVSADKTCSVITMSSTSNGNCLLYV